MTLREPTSQIPYDIRLPEAGLGWEKMGPLFERYSVMLVGDVDLRWAENYKRVVATAPSLTRFRLSQDRTTVSFTCRSTDGPVEVMGVLKILERLIERVNRDASLPPSVEPEAVPAGAVESRRGDAGARPQRGGLLARFAAGSK